MLHNQAWEVTNLESIKLWLREQPEDRAYDWGDGETCLMARYLQAKGVSHHPPMPLWYNSVTQPRPWTFGAALRRAEAFA